LILRKNLKKSYRKWKSEKLRSFSVDVGHINCAQCFLQIFQISGDFTSSSVNINLTLSQNYSTHSYGLQVSTATTLVVSTLLLVICTRLKVERTWIVKNSKITKVWKQYKHVFTLYNQTSILILLRLHMFFCKTSI
jgi:hypothetical protein